MIENLKDKFPPPEIGWRRMSISDSCSMIELTGDGEKCVHPKRWELRRVRLLDQMKSGDLQDGDCNLIGGGGRSLKKTRPDNENVDVSQPKEEGEEKFLKTKAAVGSVSFASPSSKQLKNDQVIEGTSSLVDEENKAKENKQDVVPCWSYGLNHGLASGVEKPVG